MRPPWHHWPHINIDPEFESLNAPRLTKRRAGISGPDTTLELRATCSTTLRRSLFDFMGKDTLGSADKEGLLNHIKNIAVKGKNTAVHRQEFYGMAQVAEQPIQAFVGQLRSKAMQCDFTTKCTSSGCSQNVSYSEAMVSDQMIVGLYDKDCQADVLARNQTLKTFNEKFHWIQVHEEGKRTSSISAHKSTYQQAKKRSYLPQQSGRPMDQHDNRHPKTRTSPHQDLGALAVAANPMDGAPCSHARKTVLIG